MKTASRALAIGLVCALSTTVAVAQTDTSEFHATTPRFEATPLVGYRAGGEFELPDTSTESDRSIDLDDGGVFGLDLGLYRDSSSFYELLYTRQESGLDSSDALVAGVDVTTEYLHFGGTLLFPDEWWYVPWLSLTIGATRLDPSGGGYDSETEFSASLGGGVRFPINERVAATLGVRGYVTLVDSDTAIFCVGSGDLNCLVRTSGSTFFQGEALLGLTVTF
jgi:hypothetical protein